MTLRITLCLFVVLAGSCNEPASARPFTPRDLVALSRIASPAVSPDGRWLVWEQQETDLDANKGHHSLWRLDLNDKKAAPQKVFADAVSEDTDPAFAANGQLHFLSDRNGGKTAVWRTAITGGEPLQVTDDYDVAGFKVSPAGDAILVWADRPIGAKSLEAAYVEPAASQGSARMYDQLFVRH